MAGMPPDASARRSPQNILTATISRKSIRFRRNVSIQAGGKIRPFRDRTDQPTASCGRWRRVWRPRRPFPIRRTSAPSATGSEARTPTIKAWGFRWPPVAWTFRVMGRGQWHLSSVLTADGEPPVT
jgi:hypothetical protein